MMSHRRFSGYLCISLLAVCLLPFAMMMGASHLVLTTTSTHNFAAPMTMTAYADEDDDDRRYGEREEDDDAPFEEAFDLIGKLAVVLGALSLSWYLMKRKRVSKIMPVRKTANFFYRLHTYAGWTALVLVVAHGTYYLIYEWLDDDTVTGLLAFITLIALAVYGVMLSRKRLPKNRRIHFILALIWVALTFIHAGDAIPLLIIVIGASYGMIWFLEQKSKTS